MKIALVKYNAGNIQSVLFALERLGVQAVVTDDKESIASADKVIFPGVGEASSAMSYLKKQGLHTLLPALKQPVLGICLGMQLMCAHSEEGDTDCLNIFPVKVKKFVAQKKEDKVPQIGWNTVSQLKTPLFKDIAENSFMYFVHSFYAEENEFSIASTDYILSYCSALHFNNFYAAQFHPEKSAKAGEQLLKNFLEI